MAITLRLIGSFAVALVVPALAAGCGDDPADDGETSADGGSNAGGSPGAGGNPTTGGGDVGGEGTGGSPPVEVQLQTISGDVTWTVTFDADAQAAGATDCTYTRHYEAVEDASAKWFCGGCDVMFRATVEMTAGEADCFSQISDTPPLTTEWIGLANGRFFRGIGGPMSDQGSVVMSGDDVATANQVLDLPNTAGGTFAFDVAGQLTLGEGIGDPLNGFNPPDVYACGWPKSNAPEYTGDYTVAVGQTVPDGLFLDKCNEPVRLHDLSGAYLIVDMSAVDCSVCRSMAQDEEQWVTDMADQGIEVRVVTLLAPSLADVLGFTTQGMLENWGETFDLTAPVLADRGWGLSMFIPLFGEELGYPSWVLVDPELQVMETGSGFGSFTDFETLILADAP